MEAIEVFSGPGDEEPAVVLAVFPVIEIDSSRVPVSEIDCTTETSRM